MKKLKIYFILLLLFGFTTAYAQGTRSATTNSTRATKSLEDPKLSPEEQALLLTAGEDNPSRIDESTMVDPKMKPEEMATEKDFGASNAKPAEGPVEESMREVEPVQQVKQAAPISDESQPEGEPAGTITDYRNMNGGNDQSEGEQPVNITNYKDMQGSDQQPAGDIPKK